MSRTPRIAVVSGAYPPMRIAEADHAMHVAENLAASGVDVTVIAPLGTAPARRPRLRVLPIMRTWSWAEMPRLLCALRRAAPDAVLLVYLPRLYAGAAAMSFFPTMARFALPGARVATMFETNLVPGIVSCSALERAFLKAVVRPLAGRGTDWSFGTLLRDSEPLFTLSRGHLESLAQVDPGIAGRAQVIPVPPILRIAPRDDASRRDMRRRLGASDGDFLLGYFGYVYTGKGLDTLLGAMGRLAPRWAHLRLAVIGGAPPWHPSDRSADPRHLRYWEETRDLPRRLGFEARVTWTGGYEAESDEGSRMLAALDACVFPFDAGVHANNSSLSAALSHELPVIATRAAQPEPLFRDRENMLFCPPKDAGALASAVEEVLTDGALRARLAEGAGRLAADWFSWPVATARLRAALL